jgi:DNA-binding NtrC family response regulator
VIDTVDNPEARVRALVACSEADRAEELCRQIRALGADCERVANRSEANALLSSARFDVLICSRCFAAGDGIEFLAAVRQRWSGVRRVLLGEPGDRTSPADAVNRAAIHYWIELPCPARALKAALAPRSEPRRPHRAIEDTHRDGRFPQIIGESAAITQLLELVARVARTASTVLVTGETGTGKELIGQAIHDASPRHNLPFAAVNSAAIPETLLESELFGHRRGSFTGATSDSTGLFEGADGGTVFLDEVGEMPIAMQAKLLRFLQTGEVRAIGARHATHVDVRLVAATNRCLEDEVSDGRFREDLYYRLAVIPIHVPPLRERLEDIPLLVDHFLRKLSNRYGRPGLELEDSALDMLITHDWPGNVRELENVVERGVALAKESRIAADELPLFERRRLRPVATRSPESLPSIERRHIIETLEHVGWNRKRAAEILQISTTTLWRRLKEFGIDTHASRPAASE